MLTGEFEAALGISTEDFNKVASQIDIDSATNYVNELAVDCCVPWTTAAYVVVKQICASVSEESGHDPVLFAVALANNLADVRQEQEAAQSTQDALQRILNSRS